MALESACYIQRIQREDESLGGTRAKVSFISEMHTEQKLAYKRFAGCFTASYSPTTRYSFIQESHQHRVESGSKIEQAAWRLAQGKATCAGQSEGRRRWRGGRAKRRENISRWVTKIPAEQKLQGRQHAFRQKAPRHTS